MAGGAGSGGDGAYRLADQGPVLFVLAGDA